MDYAIIIKGSIVLQLDDAKTITLNEGDIVCQRGTIHSWRNESSEWCRIYFVMLGLLFPCFFLVVQFLTILCAFRRQTRRDQRQGVRGRMAVGCLSGNRITTRN